MIGVEVNISACEDYAENLDEFDNVELYIGAAGSIYLPSKPRRISSWWILPGRGSRRKPWKPILKMKPERIAYFSCDPATLARDAKILTFRV